MSTAEIISLIAIFFGPFSAVFASQYIQDRKVKRKEKISLFLDLLSDRHLKHLSNTWVQRLNQIPIVFRSNREIQRNYEHFLSLVNGNNPNVTQGQLDESLHDLFHEIAKEVGYSSLRQTDFARYYYPQSLHEKVQGEIALYKLYYMNDLQNAKDVEPPNE